MRLFMTLSRTVSRQHQLFSIVHRMDRFRQGSDMSLCWIAIMAQKLDCDLGALTGIHDGDAVIIQLLAGVLAVQMASCLYLNGIAYRGTILERTKEWISRRRFSRISHFKGNSIRTRAKAHRSSNGGSSFANTGARRIK